MPRFSRISSAVLLILLATAQGSDASGSFHPTGDMGVRRSFHTATLLRDGKVLIAGGREGSDALRSAELYDPTTGTFTRVGDMTVPRDLHSATLLPDGMVLIVGGKGLSSAELFDPVTNTFQATGALLEDQSGHAGTLLSNGRVLITGGQRAAPPWPTAARPEIYDVVTGRFSFAGNYAGGGTLYPASGGATWSTANLLPDGRVLVVGDNPPQIYDPVTDTFSLLKPMLAPGYRYGMFWHAVTTLRDGTILISGGNDDMTCGGLADSEVYDPLSGTPTPGRMTAGREGHTSTLLGNGNVLLAGGGAGWCFISTRDDAELYDSRSGSFVAAGKMTRRRSFHTATRLNDDTVLIAGGQAYWPYETIRSAELYRPGLTAAGRHRAVRR